MKNVGRRKAFTLIELVIVIAVVAVLAAVVIPAFGGVIKKAEDSAYLQARRNCRTADAVEKPGDGSRLTWDELESALVAALDAAGGEKLTESDLNAVLGGSYTNSGITKENAEKMCAELCEGRFSSAQVGTVLERSGIEPAKIDEIRALLPETGITSDEIIAAMHSASVAGSDSDVAEVIGRIRESLPAPDAFALIAENALERIGETPVAVQPGESGNEPADEDDKSDDEPGSEPADEPADEPGDEPAAESSKEPSSCVARVGENYYETLRKAFSNSSEGDTVFVLQNVTKEQAFYKKAFSGCFTVSKSITLNGGGYTVDLGGTELRLQQSLTLADVTLTGGKICNNPAGSKCQESLLKISADSSVVLEDISVIANAYDEMTDEKDKSTVRCIYNSGTLELASGSSVSGGKAGSGGGIYNAGTLVISGGAVSGNTSTGSGGGVYNKGSFTMAGGAVSGNTSTDGGGVYNTGSLTITGGAVSGNAAEGSGGGVYIYDNRSLTMTGGVIYGSSEGENSNTVADNNGAALYLAHKAVATYGGASIKGIKAINDTVEGKTDSGG